jgi:adenosylcobinamide-phosphate guanylyltransferase
MRRIPALVMAGGRGQRLGLPLEKPLLPFHGKALIEWVVDALRNAERIAEIYIVTTKNTVKTEQKCLKQSLKVIRTNGEGYHLDLKQAIFNAGLKGPVLIVPSDLPALTGKFIDKVVAAYERDGKDALAVFVPLERRRELNLSSDSTDTHQGIEYAVSGVNIINASKILQDKLETSAIITDELEAALNINTLKDLEVATALMTKKNTLIL